MLNPANAKVGAIDGMLISINSIIPSLFPLMVVSCFLFKSKLLNIIPLGKYKTPLIIFILSCIGGYPIGAKIIIDEYKCGCLPKKFAKELVFCSINSGPAFAVLTVGDGILCSRNLGMILWISQIIPSFIILVIILAKNKKISIHQNYTAFKLTDVFVDAVADSSSAMLSICGFITLCSVIISTIKPLSALLPLMNLLEVSNAVITVKNVYFLAFILSFGGIAVILQIVFIARKLKINLAALIISRIFIALLSTALVFIALKIFDFSVHTQSSYGTTITFSASPTAISTILLITVICFIASIAPNNLYQKKYTNNFSIRY